MRSKIRYIYYSKRQPGQDGYRGAIIDEDLASEIVRRTYFVSFRLAGYSS
jgi:hypothetical protein